MSFIKTKITGYKKVYRNLEKVKSAIDTGTKSCMEDALDYIKEQSINFLKANKLGVGLKRDEQSIVNPENWEITKVESKGNTFTNYLISKSSHSQAVEYGTLNADIHAKNSKALSFMYNGKQMYRYRVKGQPPKAFFQKGMYMAKGTLLDLFGDKVIKNLRMIK